MRLKIKITYISQLKALISHANRPRRVESPFAAANPRPAELIPSVQSGLPGQWSGDTRRAPRLRKFSRAACTKDSFQHIAPKREREGCDANSVRHCMRVNIRQSCIIYSGTYTGGRITKCELGFKAKRLSHYENLVNFALKEDKNKIVPKGKLIKLGFQSAA